jgi:hypothetical protein
MNGIRSAFGVWRLAFGVWRFAIGIALREKIASENQPNVYPSQ